MYPNHGKRLYANFAVADEILRDASDISVVKHLIKNKLGNAMLDAVLEHSIIEETRHPKDLTHVYRMSCHIMTPKDYTTLVNEIAEDMTYRKMHFHGGGVY